MDKTQFTVIFFFFFINSLLYGQGPLDSLKQGLQQSENINERIQYLYKICGLYNGKNYLNDDSLRLYSSMILEVGNEESHIRELLIAHTFQAYSYFHSDTSKYFKWLSKGETLALKSGNFRQAAISCYNQAKRYENFREFDNVIKASNNGIQHLNQKGKVDTITNADESLYGRFYKKMTSAYTAKSEYDNALLWSSRLKNKAQKTSNKLLKIESYSNSIGIYLKIKEDISFGSKLKSNFEIDSLLKLTIDSMVHESKTMDNVNIVARFVRANIHLGNYFLEKNDIPKAVQSFTMVKQLATEEKFATDLINIGIGLYECCKIGNQIDCLDHLTELDSILLFAKNDKWSLKVSQRILDYYTNANQLDKAAPYFATSKNALFSIQAPQTFMGAFDILLNYTNKINAKDESYEILKFKTAIRDSMKAEILAQNIKDLQVKYEVEKTNTENAQLKESQVSTQLKYSRIFGGLIISILLGAIGFGYNNFKNKNRILQSEKRGANLKQKLLRSQINPHFTFNVLSTVQNYIFNNQGEKAANYLAKFARLLRQNLEFTDLKSITLNEEVKFIKSYLELERERKRDLFNYEVKYDGHTNQLNKSIQPLIIQPLIENSIKHGFKNIASGGFIKVLYIAKENIEIQVSDNGCGFGKSLGSKHKSLGLALIKERIEILNKQLNSNQYSMNIDSNENGTTIKVSMPYD